MPSFRSTVLALAASFIAVAHADYVIDPDSVPLSQRQSWCQNEKQTCPIICQQFGDGTTEINDCDADSLTYGCICSNGQQPNVSEYSLTLPFFVCQEWGNQCVSGCAGNNLCESSCREDHPCGATDPKRYNTTSTATGTDSAKATASATDDGTTIYTDVDGDNSGDDSGSSSSSSGDKPGAAAALEAGRTWGLTVVLGSMFVGFALL